MSTIQERAREVLAKIRRESWTMAEDIQELIAFGLAERNLAIEEQNQCAKQPKLAWGKATCHGCGYATTEVTGEPVLCGSCQHSTANAEVSDGER